MRILTLALLLLAVPAAAKDGWHTVTSAGFSIEMPAPPTAKEQKVDIGEGKHVVMREWQLLSTATGAIYDVTVAEYPKGTIDQGKIDEHLDSARNGAVANSMGPLVGETKLEIAGKPARELVMDMTMGHHSRTRILFVGDSLFSFGAIASKDKVTSPDIERFLASFKLTAK